MFDSVTYVALNSALDSLSQRQRVIANNIANINTPNYHAQRVTFEDELSRQVQRGNGAVTSTVSRSLEPTRLDGNNVNLDTETLLNIDTVLRYQLATQAVDGTFSSLRTAMRTN
ncbi:flagellar basal body rod protein FlgB [Jonesia quinghaiensis]|uniref:flagellar basal body rod protein FlgB n=1 Tax=Jonesia quinghaiensis TaxID=262806 RepID=UPI0004207CC8|nr:flagellar basal body rod protein FlgB [Jonesia quinghaiensis]